MAAYVRAMAGFLLELYVPGSDRGAVIEGAGRAGLAARHLRQGGASVQYLRSIFVPEDETCFLVYEAGSADDVRRAARLAGLPVDHVLEMVETDAR
jgi:Nickel responsive protein SCO4226-like